MTVNALHKRGVIQFIPLIAHDGRTALQRLLGGVQCDLFFVFSGSANVQRLPRNQRVTAAANVDCREELSVLWIEDEILYCAQVLILCILYLFTDKILRLKELLLALHSLLSAAGLIGTRRSGRCLGSVRGALGESCSD